MPPVHLIAETRRRPVLCFHPDTPDPRNGEVSVNPSERCDRISPLEIGLLPDKGAVRAMMKYYAVAPRDESVPSEIVDLVTEFLRHNAMMNNRLVEACRGLSAEQLNATAVGTYGSIAATLAHIANAQVGYVPRYIASERPEPLPSDPSPGMEVLAERLAYGDALLLQFAARASDEHEVKVTGDDPPGTWHMPASLFLLQAVNHGTEHRSQIATTLTQLGLEPPSMDGWTYFFASDHMTPA